MPNKLALAQRAEDWGPFGAAAICFVLMIIFRGQILPLFSLGADGWSLDNLYSAIFNWSSIQTGFVFGIYGFVVGKSDGFIAEIRRTVAMTQFLSYTKKAIIIGFMLTFASIPLVVIANTIELSRWPDFIFIAAWFSLFVWGFLSFMRVAYMFGLIARVTDKKKIAG